VAKEAGMSQSRLCRWWPKTGVSLLALGVLSAGPIARSAEATTNATQGADKPATFARDVAPILQQKCQVCHRPGSMGPMSLMTYEDVRPWARAIKERVARREMPPWHLDKTVGIQRFINDPSLTDEQIDTIVRWVDAGAPLGNPKDMPAPKQWANEDTWQLSATLGPPDFIVKAPAWTMTPHAQDAWPRPVVETGLPESRWIRAVETKPSHRGRRILHHASTRLVQAEDGAVVEAERAMRRGEGSVEAVLTASRQRDGKATEVMETFTEWAIGKGGEIYPPNTGKLVKPGSKVVFLLHYHAVGEEITDVAEMGFWFYPKEYVPKYSVDFVPVGASGPGNTADTFELPPGTVTQHQGSYTLPAPAIVHNFQPHMHMRGKAFAMEAIFPDGRRELLNHVDRFDSNWHINYIYDPDAAPVLPKGTVLQITAWHDNTSANRNNPDPRQFVRYGPRTIDEMAQANTQLIFITDEDYRRITADRKKRPAQ